MSLVIINNMIIAAFVALLLVSALEDLDDYRIPNFISIALIALYPFYVLTAPHEVSIGWSMVIGLVFFMIGLGLFSAGIMGGGDVKLIALTGLWVGPLGLFPFLFAMVIVGAIMSIFMLSSSLRHGSAYICVQMGFVNAQEKILTDKLPYGVAICAGGLFATYKMFVL
ncbi:putative Peptidase A24A prepilin type IV [Candidatus Terasakiella magnetica]|uniref:Putative Peptidase A24A prepilin type IV n=1 Tax=Candidatus Terasakiella magnetica TaxID=1867952 RepID=A0A1C3REQ0_9PROT|nr:prepilin peptidase [Candidatus Terasakiella magnetica]SCA55718.1 putative Peptidase A24A prepilin type IV [Candidatus Terasakiella magnetica]